MMNSKYASVVDLEGRYVGFVRILLESNAAGEIKEQIQDYTLAEGERLVFTSPPSMRFHAGTEGLLLPRWDGSAWEESATAEEISNWEAQHPAPPANAAPTLDQRTEALESAMLALLGGGAGV